LPSSGPRSPQPVCLNIALSGSPGETDIYTKLRIILLQHQMVNEVLKS
jgi:hypothetical protein